MSKRITVDIAPDGGVKIEGHGFNGVECEKATQFLEKALGVAGERKRKPEYNQHAAIGAQQKAGQ